MQWLEISLRVAPELAEAVADVLSRYAPGGVACQQNALELTGQEWRPDGPMEPLATVYAYLPIEAEIDLKRRQIEEALWHLGQIQPIPTPEFRLVDEEQWAEAWKEHFNVTRIGQRFVIKPSWREYTPQPDEVVIELDPGQAFGTGLHPTTQMCLHALQDYLRPGDTVLDLGTGSGILAIAAARLGAAHVLALDIDPVAVEAAQANVQLNGVRAIVQVARGSLRDVLETRFELVLVNILARTIVELCQQGLGQIVAPGGWVMLAGLIATQEAEVRHALAQAGLDVIQRMQDQDWVGLLGRRSVTG